MVERWASRWLRKRYAFPLLVLVAALLIFVSERTYRNTTVTLGGGIALTDARLQALRLQQLMTDAEAAEAGFLLTKNTQYLSRYAEARAELVAVQAGVNRFFSSLGVEPSPGMPDIDDLVQQELSQSDESLRLARGGELQVAVNRTRQEVSTAARQQLRQQLQAQFTQAAALQEVARTSIYDALLVNRIAVGVLTLFILLVLVVWLRQLEKHERERNSFQTGLVDESVRLEAEVARRTSRLTELARHLQTVQEDERSHLARELHDELGSLLTVTKLDLARARAKLADPDELAIRLASINNHLNQGIALKRRIVEDLTPSALRQLGLSIALENLCRDRGENLGIVVNLRLVELKLHPAANLAIYRFVQEALTNIGKYAAAGQVSVGLSSNGGLVSVEVQDDGKGFDVEHSRVGHHGLSGMQLRAESLGGAMRIQSAPGKGTQVRIEFPLAAVPAAANTAHLATA
ncbi:MAG: hypothetical protein JWP47_1883 [Polaromonas sp.]|jgi:signal transduction histidine kinase|nr:hypothetical protein [Polaromonas sp.]